MVPVTSSNQLRHLHTQKKIEEQKTDNIKSSVSTKHEMMHRLNWYNVIVSSVCV